jgi:hypothetical protein
LPGAEHHETVVTLATSLLSMKKAGGILQSTFGSFVAEEDGTGCRVLRRSVKPAAPSDSRSACRYDRNLLIGRLVDQKLLRHGI